MTSPSAPSPNHGPRFIMWLAIATAVVSIAAATLAGLAFDRVSDLARDANNRSQEASRVSRAACLRTRRFAPELADAYERYRILSSHALTEYRATIPKDCS